MGAMVTIVFTCLDGQRRGLVDLETARLLERRNLAKILDDPRRRPR
jgi:hypothetical protein